MARFERLLILALAALLAAGLAGCGDDDDDDGAATDADTDADADSDADSDSDSDTDVTYDGVLNGQVMGAGAKVWTNFSTDLEVSWTVRFWATEGDVNNIEIDEVRVLIDDEVFFTVAKEDVILAGMDFDGIVQVNTEKTISYKYTSATQQGFEAHCNEVTEFEIDVTYNDGETLDTLVFGGTTSDIIICVEG